MSNLAYMDYFEESSPLSGWHVDAEDMLHLRSEHVERGACGEAFEQRPGEKLRNGSKPEQRKCDLENPTSKHE